MVAESKLSVSVCCLSKGFKWQVDCRIGDLLGSSWSLTGALSSGSRETQRNRLSDAYLLRGQIQVHHDVHVLGVDAARHEILGRGSSGSGPGTWEEIWP